MNEKAANLRRGMRALVISTAIALGATGGPVLAVRSETPSNATTGQVTLAPLTVASGGSVMLTLSGFESGTFTILLNGQTYGDLTHQGEGTFAIPITVARSIPAGPSTIAVRAPGGSRISTPFTVVGSYQQHAHASTRLSAGIPLRGRTANGCAITLAQAQAEQYLLSKLNGHRGAAGVARLTLNSRLSVISRQHSCEMFQRNRLQHPNADGSSAATRLKLPGLPFSSWAENIGTGSMGGGSALDVIAVLDAQMMAEPDQSGTHRANIVHGSSNGVGLGVIVARGQVWLTEDFVG